MVDAVLLAVDDERMEMNIGPDHHELGDVRARVTNEFPKPPTISWH
jgi:hypothetical protein